MAGEKKKQIVRDTYCWEDCWEFWIDNKQRVYSIAVMLGYFVISYLFYSNQEGWSFIDCIYFALTTCTTIGYGDLAPKTNAGKMFTCAYAFFGLGVCVFSLRSIGEWMRRGEERLLRTVAFGTTYGVQVVTHPLLVKCGCKKAGDKPKKPKFDKASFRNKSVGNHIDEAETCPGRWATKCCILKPFVPLLNWLSSIVADVLRVIMIFVPLLIYISAGAIIGASEKWNLVDSYYYAFITVTTVGFGDFAPKLQSTRAMCILYIPLAIVVVANTWRNLSSMLILRQQQHLTTAMLKKWDQNHDGKVTEIEFLRSWLESHRIVAKETLDVLHTQFQELDADGDGVLTASDIDVFKRVVLDVPPDASEGKDAEGKDAEGKDAEGKGAKPVINEPGLEPAVANVMAAASVSISLNSTAATPNTTSTTTTTTATTENMKRMVV